MRRSLLVFAAIATGVLLLTGSRPKAVTPDPKGTRVSVLERKLMRASEALAQGRVDEARSLVNAIPLSRVPRGKEDEHAFLRATLLEDGDAHVAALEGYLNLFPKGRHRREVTLSLGRIRYVQGEYGASEKALSVFSPGVEKDFIGRQAIVQCGLAQLARGDAPGALQFLRSAEADLTGSPEEEAYYFALSQAALRANKPAEAADVLRSLLGRHAKGDYAPQALYAMGVCLDAVGRTGDAAGVFRQITLRYPGSYEATRVRDRGISLSRAPGVTLSLGGGFAVQVGAFSRRELAVALARDLKLAGVEDVSVKLGTETPPVIRVRAGAFARREDARALGERLRRERGFSYTVVPR